MSVTMTIPGLPPTSNSRLGAHVVGGKARLHRSKGASSWQSTVGAYGRLAMGRRPLIAERVEVRLVFRVGPLRRRDVDAGVKDTLDGLTGAVLTDDRLVRVLSVELEDVGSADDESTAVTVEALGCAL